MYIYERTMGAQELYKLLSGETLTRECQKQWHKGNFFYFFKKGDNPFLNLKEINNYFVDLDKELFIVIFASNKNLQKTYEPDYQAIERITESYSLKDFEILTIKNFYTEEEISPYEILCRKEFHKNKIYSLKLKNSFNDKNKKGDKNHLKKVIKNLKIKRKLKYNFNFL